MTLNLRVNSGNMVMHCHLQHNDEGHLPFFSNAFKIIITLCSFLKCIRTTSITTSTITTYITTTSITTYTTNSV